MSKQEKNSEYNQEAEEREKIYQEKLEHRLRMRFDWENLIEDKIQEGKEKGIFEQLKGEGKPLNLSKNPFIKEKELAHSLLKDNKMTPAWIGSRKIIKERIDFLRQGIKKNWARHEREYRILKNKDHRDSLVISWDDLCQKWEADIANLNKMINEYNLKRPIDNLEILKIDLNWELDNVNARRWLKTIE